MRSRYLLAAVVTALVFAAPAFAQRPGGGFRGFGGGFGGFGGGGIAGLLRIEEVQKEVELLDDQKEQIEKINEEARTAAQEGGQRFNFRELQDLSEEERQKRITEFREQAEKRAKEIDAKVREVLLPHQVERLEQLSVQQQGVRALMNPEVAGKLNLSEDQKKKLQSIQEEQAERMRQAFQNRGQNAEGGRPNFEEFRAQAEKVQNDMLAVLTDAQKKQFDEMKGKPFTFPQRGFGGPGVGGQRRGGEGQPGGQRGGQRGPRRGGDNQ